MDPIIESVSKEFEDFTLSESYEDDSIDPTERYCEFGKAFHQWTVRMQNDYMHGDVDEIRLAQARLLLVDRYFEFRSYAPRSHRDKVGEKGHVCLFQVFVECYNQIRMKQLSLSPPKVLIISPRPEQPQTVPSTGIAQIPALFLGEVKN